MFVCERSGDGSHLRRFPAGFREAEGEETAGINKQISVRVQPCQRSSSKQWSKLIQCESG